MTTAKINEDDDEDLIVGAPGYGKPGLAQVGRVYIIYGRKGLLDHGGLDLDRDADVILDGVHVCSHAEILNSYNARA